MFSCCFSRPRFRARPLPSGGAGAGGTNDSQAAPPAMKQDESSSSACCLAGGPDSQSQPFGPGCPTTPGSEMGAVSSLGRPGKATTDGVASCWYGCQTTLPTGRLLNDATAACPRWVCKPCHTAATALSRANQKDAACRVALTKMKKSDPDKYRGIVRSLRVIDCPDVPCVSTTTERAAKMARISQSLTNTVEVREEISVMWLTETEFIQHHMFALGMTREQAQTRFQQDSTNPQIKRRFDPAAGQQRYAIGGIPRTVGIRSRLQSRSVMAASSIESNKEEEDALKRVGETHTANQLSGGLFAEIGGRVFQPGCSSGSGASEHLQLTDVDPGAPVPIGTVASIMPDGENPYGSTRSLKANKSDAASSEMENAVSDRGAKVYQPKKNDWALVGGRSPGENSSNGAHSLERLCRGQPE